MIGTPFAPLPPSFFARPAERVARDLLGQLLVRQVDGETLVLRVVETEAYLGAPDRASHAWGGRHTARNESLYLPPGHAYVYFIYGMHFCVNVTAGEAGTAVLFRAGEPVLGEVAMAARRALAQRYRPGDVAGGPGRLCRALGIAREQDGLALTTAGELYLAAGAQPSPAEIAAGPRVGIGYAGEAVAWPLRFALKGHPHVSRPRL